MRVAAPRSTPPTPTRTVPSYHWGGVAWYTGVLCRDGRRHQRGVLWPSHDTDAVDYDDFLSALEAANPEH